MWDGFLRTFLERDIPQLGITIPAETLRRFWTMVAHFHAGVWNAAELARSLGSSESTARRYLDILAGAYMVRVLPPWFENLRKRQVKAPKVYLRDSGLLHALLGIRDLAALHDLELEHLWVVYPGSTQYDLDERISVIPLQQVPVLCARLRG